MKNISIRLTAYNMPTNTTEAERHLDSTVRREDDMDALSKTTRALEIGLARLGWEIRQLEINMANERVVLELHRADGRWLYVAGNGSVATVERWARSWSDERPYRRAPLSSAAKDEFLGRTRALGVRSALRLACSYVAENPAEGHEALPESFVRALLAPLMVTP